MNTDQVNWNELLAKSESDLYRTIGEQSAKDALPPSIERLIERGRQTFQSMLPKIVDCLCAKWGACDQLKKHEDDAQLASAVCDVLAAAFIGLPVTTISALVVKIGIKRICNCP